tara:strand:+ start:420 stop:734 length:315 start_codon:yes stop_codon:yes gene_type:complete
VQFGTLREKRFRRGAEHEISFDGRGAPARIEYRLRQFLPAGSGGAPGMASQTSCDACLLLNRIGVFGKECIVETFEPLELGKTVTPHRMDSCFAWVGLHFIGWL